MIENELIKIWQSSSNLERVKFEKSKLMIELQSSLNRLNRWWFYLQLSETILAIFGILLSTLLLFKIPFILTKIALGLMIICAVYIVLKYRGVKKFQPTFLESNYLNYLKKNREYLKTQKKFLKTYFYWGILPVYPIALLITVSIWEKVPLRLIILINLATIGIGIYGYFLNNQRVKKEINPRIDRVNELIKRLGE